MHKAVLQVNLSQFFDGFEVELANLSLASAYYFEVNWYDQECLDRFSFHSKKSIISRL